MDERRLKERNCLSEMLHTVEAIRLLIVSAAPVRSGILVLDENGSVELRPLVVKLREASDCGRVASKLEKLADTLEAFVEDSIEDTHASTLSFSIEMRDRVLEAEKSVEKAAAHRLKALGRGLGTTPRVIEPNLKMGYPS
jgi:hypothetical protein